MNATQPNIEAFIDACAYVSAHNCRDVLLTSKGEPTLWPVQISDCLSILKPFKFERVELQTNGIPIADRRPVTDDPLETWRRNGLTLVAISIVHFDCEENRKTYLPYRRQYIDLSALIAELHDFGFQVRLAVVMLRGLIDRPQPLCDLLSFARSNRVEQLTIRPVNKPAVSEDDEISQFVTENCLTDEQKRDIRAYLDQVGSLIEVLPWGARVYDVHGQNVCMTNSLTTDKPGQEIGRQLIFFPDGRVSDDWQKQGVPLADFDPEASAAISLTLSGIRESRNHHAPSSTDGAAR